MHSIKKLAISACTALLLAACGGGGASTPPVTPDTTSEAPTVTANTTSYTLALQGDFAAKAIAGIQFEVVIPPGLTVRADATSGEPLPGIVEQSLLTASAGVTTTSRYIPSDGVLNVFVNINSKTSKGVGVGDLVTITCDIVPGWSKPAASAFIVRNVKAVDGTTGTIDRVTVTVR
ncbi:MAG: hypothetical protein ACOYL3_09680 [Desulfuromonadaceae bacterium]